MERPEQDTIETFVSITGASAAVAFRKLQEHGGDLNRAVNDYFNEGERDGAQPATAAPEDDFMDVDDAVEIEPHQLPAPSLLSGSSLNPFSLLDPTFVSNLFNGSGHGDVGGSTPLVSHPREIREIPIEFKDDKGQSGFSGSKPTIEDVSSNAELHGPETHGDVTVVDDDDDDDVVQSSVVHCQNRNRNSFTSDRFPEPSAPDLVDDQNETEEAMLKAAIEASKQYSDHIPLSELDDTADPVHIQNPPVLAEDTDLARAVSLSLKTAEQEKALRELRAMNGVQLQETKVLDVPCEAGPSSVNGSASRGIPSQIDVKEEDSSIPGDSDDAEDEPFVRRRSRRLPSRYVDTSSESDQQMEAEAPSSTAEQNPIALHGNGSHLPSDEWGGISSEEHDEAIMLEAALFGAIPGGVSYRFPYPSDQGAEISSSSYLSSHSRPLPRPPSPNLTAQRLLREQQDDEYLASLLADQEKELEMSNGPGRAGPTLKRPCTYTGRAGPSSRWA